MAQDAMAQRRHSLRLEERESLTVEGVSFVASFDSAGLSLSTEMGEISVEGRDLKIEGFSKEEGVVHIRGVVTGIFYSDEAKPRKKLLERFFQ